MTRTWTQTCHVRTWTCDIVIVGISMQPMLMLACYISSDYWTNLKVSVSVHVPCQFFVVFRFIDLIDFGIILHILLC